MKIKYFLQPKHYLQVGERIDGVPIYHIGFAKKKVPLFAVSTKPQEQAKLRDAPSFSVLLKFIPPTDLDVDFDLIENIQLDTNKLIKK